jgi:5-formyltetrahydrofolate cyclo-ligase
VDKNSFRKICRQILNKKNRYSISKKIEKELLKELSKKKYKNILLYVSMDNEVNTKLLIKKLRLKNKQIFVPFMQELSFKMVKYSLPLVKKKFNIYEPKNKNKTKIKVDIAVVPIIGMDINFKRVGFGKGMYDRFFDTLKYKPKIIFTQLYPCIIYKNITDKYDIKANSLITYNLVCERRKNGNRSLNRLGCISYSRVFSCKKDRQCKI